jgi:hypothetical protein
MPLTKQGTISCRRLALPHCSVRRTPALRVRLRHDACARQWTLPAAEDLALEAEALGAVCVCAGLSPIRPSKAPMALPPDLRGADVLGRGTFTSDRYGDFSDR